MDRFAKGAAYFATHEYPYYRELYRRLAKGQNPQAMVIACSDSRLVLSKLFGSNAGDLFVLRTAGLMIPEYGTVLGGEQATIEMAVKMLRVKDIILLGHTDCGAVKAQLQPDSVDAAEFPALSHMLGRCGVSAAGMRAEVPSVRLPATGSKCCKRDSRADQVARLHLLRQLETLQRYPFINGNAAVTLHGCIFDIKRGMVLRYESSNGQFEALYG